MFFILIMLVKGFYKWQQIIVKNIYTKTLKNSIIYLKKKTRGAKYYSTNYGLFLWLVLLITAGLQMDVI